MGEDVSAEDVMKELRERWPDQARRVALTETVLGSKATVVVGGLSTTQRTLSDCMAIIREKWAVL